MIEYTKEELEARRKHLENWKIRAKLRIVDCENNLTLAQGELTCLENELAAIDRAIAKMEVDTAG